jgi:hypothetical protein
MLKDMHQNTTVDTCKQEISEAPPSAAAVSAPKSADALGAMSSPEAISKCAGEVAFFKCECSLTQCFAHGSVRRRGCHSCSGRHFNAVISAACVGSVKATLH